MRYYAGMDIGGSYARILLASENGAVIKENHGAGATINIVGYTAAEQVYARLVLETLASCNLKPENCKGLCVAASGADSPALAEECKTIFTKMGFAAAATVVVNDCEVYLLGKPDVGIVLTVGTGSIAYGRTQQGKIVRCGGWGQLLSDEASGFYMGLQVLKAAGDYLDNRVSCPILYALFKKCIRLESTLDINRYAVEHLSQKNKIAMLAPLLDEAALKGEAYAQKILENCAELMYTLVADTYGKLHVPKEIVVPVVLWGSVLTNSTIVANMLKKKILNRLPATVEYPEKTALETALHVAATRWQ